MSDIQQWYYADASGQQYGPASADQLQELAASGQVTLETQVWTEGLEEWVPASQVEGLIPAPQHQPQINLGPPSALAPQQVNPYAQPGTQPGAAVGMVAAQPGGAYPIPLVSKANFNLYLWTTIGGAVLFIFGMIKNAMDSPTAEEMMTNPNALQETSNLGWIMFLIGMLLLIVPGVLNLVFLHRVWTLLQPGGASISPGKAIGLLFIPFFGGIWALIVLFKLPGEWNNIVSRYTNTAAAPRLSIGTVFCMMFLPIIGSILWASEISKAINFMVTTRMMPAHPQAPSQGGMSFY